MTFGSLGDSFRHFKCLNVESVFCVLSRFLRNLSRLALNIQSQGSLVSELLASGNRWAFFEQNFLRFQLFRKIRCVIGNPGCSTLFVPCPSCNKNHYHLTKILVDSFAHFVNVCVTNWLEWIDCKVNADAFVVRTSKTSEVLECWFTFGDRTF